VPSFSRIRLVVCNPVTSCSYVLFRNEPWTDRCIITALVSYYAVLSSCIETIFQKPVLVTGSLNMCLGDMVNVNSCKVFNIALSGPLVVPKFSGGPQTDASVSLK
jgi:hypothetical protein